MFKLWNTHRLFYTVVLIALLLTTGLRQPVRAAPGAVLEITVDTTVDDYNLNACSASPNDCSLRGAIRYANDTPADSEIHITIPAGTYRLSGANKEDLNVTGDLDIIHHEVYLEGAGRELTILNGAELDRIFDVHSGTVTVKGLTVTDGLAPAGDGGGGGIKNSIAILTLDNVVVENNVVLGTSQNVDIGGGIANVNSASIHILNSIIRNNQACNGAGFADNAGWVTIYNSRLIANHTTDASGCGNGGGIATVDSWQFELAHTIVEGNTATIGGGIYYDVGSNRIFNDSIIRGNNASDKGGGLYNNGNLTLNRVTLCGNQASSGGGIANYTEFLSLNNVTVSGNIAEYGGGLMNEQNAYMTLDHCTIASNNASVAGTAYYGLIGNGINLHNNILAGSNPGHTYEVNGISVINDQGYNLCSDDTCPVNESNHNLKHRDPLLGALGFNGGWTPTMALLAGSPAIDAADPALTQTLDQRGALRPVDGDSNGSSLPDIGAYEFGSIALDLWLWLPLIVR